MIYITNTAFLNGTMQPWANSDNPLVFYKSVLAPEDIQATQYMADRPAINMWNPDTASVWQGQAITNTPMAASYHEIILANPGAALINYIAVAGHNLNLFTYTIECSYNGGTTWASVDPARVIFGDTPIIHFFNGLLAGLFKIKLERVENGSPGFVPAPVIAHIKMGGALVLQRRNYVGYEPPAIKARTIENGSDNGQYLGQVIIRKYREPGAISQQNNSPDFIRNEIYPFLEHCVGIPFYDRSAATTFFFAWRPSRYPAEVVYAWPTDIGYPSNQGSDSMGGRMQWSLGMGAIL